MTRLSAEAFDRQVVTRVLRGRACLFRGDRKCDLGTGVHAGISLAGRTKP
jgi:hypothetical protein